MLTAHCPVCGTWFATSTDRDHHLAEDHQQVLGHHQVGAGAGDDRLSTVLFADRADAGRRLSRRLDIVHVPDPVVIGLPRGGMPVAYEVATALDAPLDVLVVGRLRVPSRPDMGLGVVAEGGVQVVDREAVRAAGLADRELAAVAAQEQDLLRRRVRMLRGDRPLIPLTGRTVIVVDDGMNTGSTAWVACRLLRQLGPDRIVLAVPVAVAGLPQRLAGAGGADEVVCLESPPWLSTIGQHYESFVPVGDEDVAGLLRHAASDPGQLTGCRR